MANMPSNNVNVSSQVRDLVTKIISENGFKLSSQITYFEGSQPGDGYATKTLIVKITDDEKSLSVFLKCPLDLKKESANIDSLYMREIFFYKTIYPTYQKFLQDKKVKDGFSSVPKSLGFCEKNFKGIVALENLREKGFTLFDKTKHMNHDHFDLIFRTFAKFHAISFAMKDQNRELHDQFCDHCPNVCQILKSQGFEKAMAKSVTQFVSKLDPENDRYLIERLGDNLGPKIEDHILNLSDHLSEYSILTKGDCWVNNMMILYEVNFFLVDIFFIYLRVQIFQDKNEEYPKDLALIDWQCVTRASPVHDFASLFYSVASEETVCNYKHYLRLYHDELKRRIKELGSDADVLYPYSVFEKEWRDYWPYSFGLAVTCMKVILCQKDEVPNMEDAINSNDVANVFNDIKGNEIEWMRRVKYLARHFIDIGAL